MLGDPEGRRRTRWSTSGSFRTSFQYVTFKAGVEDFDGLPVINLTQVPLEGWNSPREADDGRRRSRRSALVVLSPLFPSIALAIWLEDRGPVFYRRSGWASTGGSSGSLKFRSMRVGAEDETGAVWAEGRTTRGGRASGAFLRR